jgi:DNA-binding winged helix-turn-helix (wHTH) protein
MGSVTYRFGGFDLDPRLGELCHDRRPIRIEPRALALLCYLVEHRDRVVSKKELLDTVWDGGFVTEAALTTGLRTVRLAIGDTGRRQGFIRTVHGRGYQFVAATTESPTGSAADAVADTTAAPITTVAADTAAGSRDIIRFCRTADGTRIAWAAAGTGQDRQLAEPDRPGTDHDPVHPLVRGPDPRPATDPL